MSEQKQEFAESAKIETREIATTRDGRDITRGYVNPLMLLQPQDTVLRARGGNYEIYREVLRDDQVKATFEQRLLGVISREWEIVAGGDKRADKKAADFLREQLDHVGWDRVTDKMLYGVFYGYAVAEPLWARDGAQVVLDQLRVRDRRRFGFDGEGRLRLLTMASANPGELLPDRKFWSFATGADHDDEPYGLGLAHWLYWPVLFKRGGMKFWLIFLEKFGQPTAKGEYPPNATPEEKQRLLGALEAITTDAGVILPQGMAIDLIEAARSGTADYTALHDRMNQTIAKVVLGQALTTEAVGGQYKADVQMAVRQDIVKADADLVCESFNRTIVRWLTDWNFPDARPPRVSRRIADEPDLKPQAERDKIVFDMGFRPSLKYIQNTYGEEWENGQPVAQPAAPSPVPAQFAEIGAAAVFPDQAALDLALSAIDDAALQAQAEALLRPVLDFIEHEGPEAALGKLASTYPHMNAEALQELLARAMFVADVWGRLNAKER